MLNRTLLSILLILSPVLACADSDMGGSDYVEIQDGQRLAAVASTYLEERIRATHADIRRLDLQIVGRVRQPQALSPAMRLVPRQLPSITVARRMRVQVDVVDAGKVIDSIPVWFSVSLHREVLVSARVLRPNEPVADTDFVLAERDVAPLGNVALVTLAGLAGKRARHYLAPETMVKADDLVAAPAVARHQAIRVAVVTPSVVIETTGIAQEDGILGQVIKVRNMANEATYYAQVVDSGHAQHVPR